MNHYETVFILNPVLSEDQIKETVKKYEHGKHRHNRQRKHFLSFVLSADRILGRESIPVVLSRSSRVRGGKKVTLPRCKYEGRGIDLAVFVRGGYTRILRDV